jgi:large subunit ribosomal protein L15e
MNSYKYINRTFRNEYSERSQELKQHIAAWRRQAPVERVAKPTNVARARELGYKAKQGVVVARVRVRRGLSHRGKITAGRKPSKEGRYYAFRKSLQSVAEERAAAKFTNCEVLNSYYVGEDGDYKFFEVVLLDATHPSVLGDRSYAGVVAQRGRASRGLTSSGRKHRGLVNKGFGTSWNRPSVKSGQSRNS